MDRRSPAHVQRILEGWHAQLDGGMANILALALAQGYGLRVKLLVTPEGKVKVPGYEGVPPRDGGIKEDA